MQFICVVTASYTLGFLMTKTSWLAFQMKHEISKQFFHIFFYGKNAYHTIFLNGKANFVIFIYLLLHYEIV